MTDFDPQMDGVMTTHWEGFGAGREYERKQIVQWLRSLDAESGDINRHLPTTLANWIEEGMHNAA